MWSEHFQGTRYCGIPWISSTVRIVLQNFIIIGPIYISKHPFVSIRADPDIMKSLMAALQVFIKPYWNHTAHPDRYPAHEAT